jgi:argininosuccinate synthase
MYVLTREPENAPDKPQYIEIEFKNGNAVAVDGVEMTPAQLLAHLNEIGGIHGIGRVDLLENRSVGMKSRGVYETPGGTILREAHSAVEQITMDREVMRIRDSLIPQYAWQIYAGYWFSPERLMLQTLIDDSQKCVNGVARLKLYKGHCRTVGRKSETDSLFNLDFATFEKDQVYNQADAEGFIKVNSLRLRIRSLMQANRKK